MARQNNKKMKVAKIMIAVIIPVVAGTILFSVLPISQTEPREVDLSAYDKVNMEIKQALAEREISMSSPIKLLNPSDIKQYCSFFADPTLQNLVRYCTSTELTGKDGEFLGNIHAVGELEVPQVVMVLVQVPFMSEVGVVKTIFEATIDGHVCQCWEDVAPDGFSNLGDWIEGLEQFHRSDIKPHSKSKQIELNQKVLQLEITTNKDGDLWHLFIYS